MNNKLTKSLLAIGFAIFCAGCDQSPTAQLKRTIEEAKITPRTEVARPSLLAGSFCVRMPTDDFSGSQNVGTTSDADYKITLLVFSPKEDRDFANNNFTVQQMAKEAAIELAKKDGYVAFTIEGRDQYYATSPLNIVTK